MELMNMKCENMKHVKRVENIFREKNEGFSVSCLQRDQREKLERHDININKSQTPTRDGQEKVHRLTHFFGNAHKLGMKPFRKSSNFFGGGYITYMGPVSLCKLDQALLVMSDPLHWKG